VKRFLIPLLAALALSTACSNSEVSNKIHKRCKDAKDYVGCVQMMGEDKVSSRKNYSVNKYGYRKYVTYKGGTVEIHPDSIKAKKIRNKYGRYLTFFINLKIYQEPTTGYSSPGYRTPTYADTTIIGNTATTTITGGQIVGARNVPSTPGGNRFLGFQYTADCIDYTFDGKGDQMGWQNVKNFRPDSVGGTIGQIMDEFCPKINQLAKSAE